jgi:hypothetical protein
LLRWLKRLGLAALIVVCAGLLADSVYRLYVAFEYRLVDGAAREFSQVGAQNWVAREDAPLWFWWSVAIDSSLVLLFAGLLRAASATTKSGRDTRRCRPGQAAQARLRASSTRYGA